MRCKNFVTSERRRHPAKFSSIVLLFLPGLDRSQDARRDAIELRFDYGAVFVQKLVAEIHHLRAKTTRDDGISKSTHAGCPARNCMGLGWLLTLCKQPQVWHCPCTAN